MSRRHRRHHEVLRAQEEFAKSEAQKRRDFWHNVLVFKFVVFAGFLLTLALPPDHQWWAGLAVNGLWLFKG